jgi:cyclic pyranopterin phosphate synthase
MEGPTLVLYLPSSTPGDDRKARDGMSLIDPFGRDISYLRVSVTDRCDFRCTYCMAEDVVFLPEGSPVARRA